MNLDIILEETRVKREAVSSAEELLEAHFAELSFILKPRFDKYFEAARSHPGLAKAAFGMVGEWVNYASVVDIASVRSMLAIGLVVEDLDEGLVNYVYMPIRYLTENWEELLAADIPKAQSKADNDD